MAGKSLQVYRWHFNRIFGDRLVRLMKMKAAFGRLMLARLLEAF